MVTQIVDEIEARGLAERRRNPDDRRSYLVSITPEGRESSRPRAVRRRVQASSPAAIGEDGDRELRALLRKMVGA